MFPPQFDYRRATSVDEALELLVNEPDAEVLAGGHSLIPAMKNEGHEPGTVIDIAGIDALSGIEHEEAETRIGALTTYADLLDDDRLEAVAPGLVEAAQVLGDRQIRNRGTVGGNLAAAEPGSDLPAAAIVAGAVLHIEDREGSRSVPAANRLPGPGPTVGEEALLTAISVPHSGENGMAYEKKTHPATGYALVGVAARVETSDDVVTDASIAATGVFERPVRLEQTASSLEGTVGDGDDIERAAARATDGFDVEDVRSDPHASSEFRSHLLSVYVERALESALDRARQRPTPG